MRFLVDAQLPPALVRWLIAQGHEATHVFDLNLTTAPDPAIWEHATATSAVIVTKDEDFSLRIQLGHEGPAVIWIRLGNLRTRPLLEKCAAVWADAVAAIERGEHLVEIA